MSTNDNKKTASNMTNLSNVFHQFEKMDNVPDEIFKGYKDRYNGITINSKDYNNGDIDFAKKLQDSLKYWSENCFRTIWFNIETEKSDWVPHLVKNGFDYHHAKQGYVLMFKWLPSEPDNLPKYAHTMLGVGGLVINKNNEVLVVREKHAIVANFWKLPGGYVEPGENLVDAVIREVKEETQIETKFLSVVSLRHAHGAAFDCSDIYTVIALEPISDNIIPAKCNREIAEVKWISAEDFLNNDRINKGNRLHLQVYLENKAKGIVFDCEDQIHQTLKKEYKVYYVKHVNESNNKIIENKKD
ncbi:uncharacterized protein LOC129618412 isoform X2 [Condylostylus longicornis]|nr:uncharacterized protein LOC129618412 isoform X2 [Condylostylus longicornis]